MRAALIGGIAVGVLLVASLGNLSASEADELRERAKAMRKEAAVLAEQGKKDEAQRLEKEAAKLLEMAERKQFNAPAAGADKMVQQLKERLRDLLAQEQKLKDSKAPEKVLVEVRKQISEIERHLQGVHAGKAVPVEQRPEVRAQIEKLEAATRSIHHLRVAAENLKLADAHDLARQLMEKAESMEREVQGAKKQLAEELQKAQAREQGPDAIQELRAEIERLRAEVKELRQKLEKR